AEEDVEAVTAVLRGDWLTTGPAVTAFENAISELAGGHRAVSCTSGTAALHIAYAALGVGPGDEVVTTPMTFVATASCAAMLGARVVFADIDYETGLLDPTAVAAALTDRSRVISAVDYAGQAADYPALQVLADRVGAYTLADAAHSVGGTAYGRPVGDLAGGQVLGREEGHGGDVGEGGAVVCKDPAVAQRAHETA
ncbi:DegT/DnrJ/EryC1/StrS aminotransferase family protein, partial [Streptomyces sp. WAC06614]|uniref:DegT/DnrJ/EryC1/StrS family aminotransferase n=1 Tax=Streptomyces sp. WAC06614 TaxID=2487416 RepID=UPI000F7ABA04